MSEPRNPSSSDAARPDRETLIAWDREHVWHPFTALRDWSQSDPLIIERGEGVYLFDDRGRRYLDAISSLWCNVHGHRHPALDRAIRDQLDRVAHVTLLGLTHPTAIELARRLVELAPEGLNRVFFSDDGATAVEVALKMAFQYWNQKDPAEPRRTRFVSLTDAYHGDTLGDVSVGGVDRFHTMFQPLLFEPIRVPAPHCWRCPIGLERSTCGIACLDELERVLETHRGSIAGVIVEPVVQGAAGMITQPEGWLRGVRELCTKHDTLLICDEVAVGFGRTGKMFACEHEGITPDFLCLAKGLTGGYLPLAATLTTDRIHAAFDATAAENKTFYHGHTYAGNPLGAAVALATLRVFEEEGTLERMKPAADRLGERLERLRSRPFVGDVRRRGLMAGIELVADVATRAPFPWSEQVGARVCRRARDFDVIVRPLGDVIVIMPPLVITVEEIDLLMDVIERCLEIELGAGRDS
ncbi:MAG: adenosylmethionine--8-amino-7-oxononanoate transaminase [Isosphaeraceae bacterium]|nr:adenosylmethionine--8-amino-7-oxononanoate transaminase [Isosphaeraceae bacterium]